LEEETMPKRIHAMPRARALSLAAALSIGTMAASVSAATIGEIENNNPTGTGSLISFANAQLIDNGVNLITGGHSIPNDVDLFRFDVSAGLFEVTLTSQIQIGVDGYQPNFYLFDSNFLAKDYDLDDTDGDPGLGIDLSIELDAGTYYLAVGGLNNHPICNSKGTCFVYDFVDSQPVYKWNGLGQGTGTYELVVTSVPEASTYAMMLAGLGLIGTAMRKRTRQQAGQA
jgi:hypothetical protein